MDISSFHFTTDDGESIAVFLGDSIHRIDDEGNVVLQVPVFSDQRSGVIYLTEKGLASFLKSNVIKEGIKWALRGRMSPKK
jgi:hypothetical protein